MSKRASRSRHGCSRCKERRLKCDETRPFCHQCQRRNVACPGYVAVVRWSDKYEVLREPHRRALHESTTKASNTSRAAVHVWGLAPTSVYPNAVSFTEASKALPSPLSGDGARQENQACTSKPASQNAGNTLIPSIPPAECALGHYFDHIDDDFADFGVVDQVFWDSMPALTPPDLPALSPLPNLSPPCSVTALSALPCPVEARGERPERGTVENAGDEKQRLLKHYFDSVLPINSLFDSAYNPFRYLVSQYVDSSPLICNCVLSLSAMHLMQRDSDMHRKVVKYHSAAFVCLSTAIDRLADEQSTSSNVLDSRLSTSQRYMERLQEALLALLLFGNSTLWKSWLDPADLGVTHLLNAREIVGKWLGALQKADQGSVLQIMRNREASFIIGAMAYWEASVAFVFDQPLGALGYLRPFSGAEGSVPQNHPNPWTGVSTAVFINIAQVGIYVRHRRAISKIRQMGWHHGISDTMLGTIMKLAAETEQEILRYNPPLEPFLQYEQLSSELLSELESLAYTYKHAALLELYRSFPELNRASNTRDAAEDEVDSLNEHDSTLFYLAVNLLSRLRDTAERQATSLAHTLALVIGGSALFCRLDNCAQTDGLESKSPIGLKAKVMDILSTSSTRPRVVERWRSFVRDRLNSNAEFVGLKSFGKMAPLLEEVWSRMDALPSGSRALKGPGAEAFPSEVLAKRSQSLTHWLDVMDECRLQTVFG